MENHQKRKLLSSARARIYFEHNADLFGWSARNVCASRSNQWIVSVTNISFKLSLVSSWRCTWARVIWLDEFYDKKNYFIFESFKDAFNNVTEKSQQSYIVGSKKWVCWNSTRKTLSLIVSHFSRTEKLIRRRLCVLIELGLINTIYVT